MTSAVSSSSPLNFDTNSPAARLGTAMCGAVMSAGTGAIAGALFTPVGAVGGAIFGASYSLSSTLITVICEQLNCCPDSPIAKVATFALSLIGGIAAGVGIATALGFQMTVATGVILVLASAATSIALGCLGVCCCGAALAGGLAWGGFFDANTRA